MLCCDVKRPVFDEMQVNASVNPSCVDSPCYIYSTANLQHKTMVRKHQNQLNKCYLCELRVVVFFAVKKHTNTSCSTSHKIMKLLLSVLGGQPEELGCD